MIDTEREHIGWIRSRVGTTARVAVGIGDDTAVLSSSGADLLVTTDMLLEGVHFEWSTCSARAVGRKAMNVNLSDIAAMAGRPTAAVVAVAIPPGMPTSFPQDLFFGLLDAAAEFDVAIVGGDTNRSESGVVVAVTVIGEPTGAGPVLRSGAKEGDVICVTGNLGYSRQGRHLTFTPRVREAQTLHACCRLHAMIDLSDGLGSDLYHLTTESRCGAILDADAIPTSQTASTPGRASADPDDRSAIDHALDDGEDFELLFTTPPSDAARLIAEQPLAQFGVAITAIGRMVAGAEVHLRQGDELRPLDRRGFVHRW